MFKKKEKEMKKFMKCMVSLIALIQVVGCSAMDVGKPSNVVLKNVSGYAIQVLVAYGNGQTRHVVIDSGQEENLGPVSNLTSFKYAGYGEFWGKTSVWNEYSSEQVNALRQNQQVGVDLVLTLSTWLQKFFVDKQIEHRRQPRTGAVESGGPQLPRQEGMLILKWFPRVHAKLLQKHTPYVLSKVRFAVMEDMIKEGREIRKGQTRPEIEDYYFLRLPADATRVEIENEYRWQVEQVNQSLTHNDDEKEIVLKFLREARDSMLKKLQ
jgi:hypothetical protein